MSEEIYEQWLERTGKMSPEEREAYDATIVQGIRECNAKLIEHSNSLTKAAEPLILAKMINAGVTELFKYDPQFSNERDVVVMIYRAMHAESMGCDHVIAPDSKG